MRFSALVHSHRQVVMIERGYIRSECGFLGFAINSKGMLSNESDSYWSLGETVVD